MIIDREEVIEMFLPENINLEGRRVMNLDVQKKGKELRQETNPQGSEIIMFLQLLRLLMEPCHRQEKLLHLAVSFHLWVDLFRVFLQQPCLLVHLLQDSPQFKVHLLIFECHHQVLSLHLSCHLELIRYLLGQYLIRPDPQWVARRAALAQIMVVIDQEILVAGAVEEIEHLLALSMTH